MNILLSIVWVLIWTATIWSTVVLGLNFSLLARGRRDKGISFINIAVPALCWAIIIVFWMN